jgi:hypothetical protein
MINLQLEPQLGSAVKTTLPLTSKGLVADDVLPMVTHPFEFTFICASDKLYIIIANTIKNSLFIFLFF